MQIKEEQRWREHFLHQNVGATPSFRKGERQLKIKKELAVEDIQSE